MSLFLILSWPQLIYETLCWLIHVTENTHIFCFWNSTRLNLDVADYHQLLNTIYIYGSEGIRILSMFAIVNECKNFPKLCFKMKYNINVSTIIYAGNISNLLDEGWIVWNTLIFKFIDIFLIYWEVFVQEDSDHHVYHQTYTCHHWDLFLSIAKAVE